MDLTCSIVALCFQVSEGIDFTDDNARAVVSFCSHYVYMCFLVLLLCYVFWEVVKRIGEELVKLRHDNLWSIGHTNTKSTMGICLQYL